MEKVQHMTRAAIRRASTMEVPQQAKQNMQELFVNFCLILICLLLIYIIVLLIKAHVSLSIVFSSFRGM
ncbi:cardiac phospholamban isoform X1 [Puntigrus tetrazona]|uniref:cardiac phospholamban isoform X1 n=1 Tax=Puntigrus tetrazona TaxID=1606681 RepID=UPI001C89F3A6|nr:cardiac phospholamban isoform X1 [Puntigrus tetrazona]